MDNRRELKRAPRFWPGRWTRAALLLTGGMTVVSAAPLPRPTEAAQVPITLALSGELAVLTYNVKGLSWPVASGRDEALARIGARLAAMRRQGRQAGVVVLQEAFTAQAKAIGTAAGYAWQVQGTLRPVRSRQSGRRKLVSRRKPVCDARQRPGGAFGLCGACG